MKNIFTRADLEKRYKKIHRTEKPKKKNTKITYTVKFLNKAVPLGVRRTFSYKVAMREAERWVLSGDGYVSRIEWEAVTGIKFVELDYYTVQQQRRARIAYRQVIKNNQFQSPYVSV